MVPRPSRTRSNARRARRGGFQGKLRPPEGLESRQLLNADPVLLADAFEVQQNSVWQDLDLLANDEFPDDYTGSRLIGAVSYGSEGGAIRIIDGGQRVSYSPAPDFTGSESFSYFVSGITQTVVVSVVAPLTDDYYEILPGPESHVLDVSANDTYWDDYDGLRQITSISHSDLGGEVEIAPDGRSLIYTPPELEFGKDQIIYVVDGRYPARVTIEIPDPLESDRFEMLEDAGPTTLDVLANDPFWVNYEGTRTITRLLPGENNTGTIAISADGRSISYTPAPDFYGAESFRYVVDESYEASVTVRVHHPVQDDFLRVDENSTAYEIFVLGNDYYFNFDHEMVRVVESITSVGPTDAGGVVTISADGRTLKYTPPENYVGTDTFTYIADGKYTARVRMNVERPVRDDWFDVYQNHVGIRLDVLTNDFLGNGYAGPRQITSVSATEAGGEISIAPDGKSIVYTPVAEYVGSDAFTYIVDGDLEASVFLDVRPIQVSHSKHLCVMPDSLVFAFDPISGTEAFGPYYPGARAITSVTQPEAGGEVRIVDGHRLELTVDIARSYVFEATVDGRYPVHVRVDVGHHLTNDHSVVDQNSAENSIDVLANDFTTRYCDGHRVTYNGSKMITSVSETAEGGQIAIAPDGKSIIYTPPADFSGTDTFTYIVDGHMEATGSIEVIRRVRDDVYRVDPDSTPTDLPLLANDGFGTDYFGAREITRVGTPEHGGQIAIAADGKSISYTPVPGFVGTDTFLY
ncbi:MAG: hypothetical protein KDA99_06760 [Planctomycetales bacterium]|nr:hypothetical protein [Planctomycetales bacterium]